MNNEMSDREFFWRMAIQKARRDQVDYHTDVLLTKRLRTAPDFDMRWAFDWPRLDAAVWNVN